MTMRRWLPVLAVGMVLIVGIGSAREETVQAGESPRIAMLWSPADGKGGRAEKLARYDLVLMGPEDYGLEWEDAEHADLAETLVPESVAEARRNLAAMKARNPKATFLFEIYFYEADEEAYPAESPWWFRNEKGERVRFWPGCYDMDVANPEYRAHVVKRIAAVNKALGGGAGLFLDNLRFTDRDKAGWKVLLADVRKTCGEIPILVNAGWESVDLEWVAPLVHGIMYEDALNHTSDKDEERFYDRVRRQGAMLRSPRISVNEIFDDRRDRAGMERELARTLVYTDAVFLYADSTEGHRHAWWPHWDGKLGRAKAGPVEPAAGRLARREFERGVAFWLPANAKGPERITLPAPMTPLGERRTVREIRLEPGQGAVLRR